MLINYPCSITEGGGGWGAFQAKYALSVLQIPLVDIAGRIIGSRRSAMFASNASNAIHGVIANDVLIRFCSSF